MKLFVSFLAVALVASPMLAIGAEPAGKSDKATYEKSVALGIAYLKAKGQADDGSFSGFAGAGPTALITTSLLRNGLTPDDPTVAKALKFLEGNVQKDGGIYKTGTFYKNYETCVAILCFKEANADKRYDKIIADAAKFVEGVQWAEDEDKDPSDPYYGGGGYGHAKRPDLSNTSFLVDALKAAGSDEDSEAMKRAMVFVSRCQNLETNHNTTPFAGKVNDGGFYYTPVGKGASEAGTTANGGLRSYGAMTYSGLKSMVYAGVDADDPRVKAAVEWVKKNYDLKSNPGVGNAGLFYYYLTFAKALDALDTETVEDAAGEKHDWKAELTAELAGRQQKDGSWVNANEKWLEGDANLATGFALLALSYSKPE